MPSHSRSRDRYRGRDGERDPDYTRRKYREVYDDDDDDDDDFDYHPRERRRYRRDDYHYDARRHEPRDYDDDLNEYDVAAEDPAVPLRSHDAEGIRRERSRAPGSPAPSPSKRDRRRDREEYKRHRTYGDFGSPIRKPRDGKRRSRDGQRERPSELDREARRQRRRERARGAAAMKHKSSDSTNSGSHILSADALAKLSSHYQEEDRLETSQAENQARMESKRQRKRPIIGDEPQTLAPFPEETPRGQSKGRIVSGAYLEEGRHPEMEVRHRGGGGPSMEARWRKERNWGGSMEGSDVQPPFWKRKKWWIVIGVLVVVLAIIIPVAVVMTKKHGHDDNPSRSSDDNGDSPYTSSLDGLSHDSIPEYAKGSVLDPWTWYDTRDFNLTFTNETVGGLPIMGLNATWDDSARPNDNVPPLNESFPYGSQPIRGVNLGGWLSLEPFIVPSFFEKYTSKDGVIDEYTLCKKLGSSAASKIEKHYASFISEQDFADMRDAGLDHVRIQFSYWAVTTYDDDPYVAKISWRYLLRAIEYCRKYGLRVKLDPHGIPGSQNGWNHSGRQGVIGWLNGTDGQLNRQRSLDFHDRVSQFFAQPRYKNVVAIYGLVNEPLMLALPVEDVLNWTTDATKLVQKNGISAFVAVHDGFLNLSKWKKMLKNRPDRMLLDTHQYTIFNTGQIVLNHTDRVKLICNDWYHMIQEINTTSAGWGPTICGEWSQADTDCAKYLNNVGRGVRWEGTFATGDSTAYCPTADTGPTCSCASANAPPSDYSDGYKKFLQTYAEAQMSAFETAQGWFYWTWHTESAAQWSYKTAWKNGYMPKKAYAPDFKCGDDIPSFGNLPEFY
ncbi:putative exo-beta-1,3-glucanase [Aspergillus alliaceus]|uniref:putative exo-beta-1,3-glucanase n=1 Tax=Petromyces alliaceus TaxID=209559 RepID=UPI0012A603AB|nr:putative glucan 1,3-beta-glucosidase D [Aspergillus alliaceus]KAB8227512.1 putative glucan 1,3-beta-glucosidase D [Aspergillus alliaceus]